MSTEHIDAVPGPAGGDLEAIWDAEWERHLFNAAADKVKQQVNPEHYQLFDLYVIQKWLVKKITATLGVSAGHVYLARNRVGGALRKEIMRLEKDGK